jgi:hypothetical protein
VIAGRGRTGDGAKEDDSIKIMNLFFIYIPFTIENVTTLICIRFTFCLMAIFVLTKDLYE